MPYINIRLGTTLKTSQHEHIHAKATSLISSLMGKRSEVTVVHIQESDSQFWSTNASSLKPNDPISAYVNIKITSGTNSAKEKALMISETVKMLKDCIGVVQEACYVTIDEIPADSWGYDGKTQADRLASNV